LENLLFAIESKALSFSFPVYERNCAFEKVGEKDWLLEVIIELTPEQLQRILENDVFSTQKEILTDFSKENLQKDLPLSMKLLLAPDRAPMLEGFSGKTEDLASFFQQLRREKPESEIWKDESWLALEFEQKRIDHPIKVKSLWSFCDWEAAAKGEDIGQVLYNGFMAFAKESGLAKELGDAVGSELMGSDLVQSLLESFISSEESEEKEEPHESTEESVDSLSNVFSKLIDDTLGNPASLFDSTPEPSPTSLFNQLIQFLVAEDWGFTRMPGEESLQIDFQGSSLRWICYARVLSENHYLLFYSYYPLPVEQKDYIRIHEFLALANLDMINGNFEFDTEEGHIRYKTSLWTDQKELSQEAFRQLIFSNVNIADDYFPALERMIKEGVGAKDVLKG
jgi:hypothetical protein